VTTKYLIDIPNLDPSKPWIVIKECDTKDKAISFTKKTWGAENGYLCLISYDGEYFNIDVPNSNYTGQLLGKRILSKNATYNNQFLTVEGFHHKADALNFAQENYQTNDDGYVSLISRV
jgi:hypothetical protein